MQETGLELKNNDILVLAQKIVSKAEGRMVNLATVTPSQVAIDLAQKTEKDPRVVELMLQESNEVVRFRKGTIVVEHKLGLSVQWQALTIPTLLEMVHPMKNSF
ncbi:MAG: coenzyme F420-0:L-glutamate ligase [Anaerolineales bacterium]